MIATKPPGALLADAADQVWGAYRLLVAALIQLEEAELLLRDRSSLPGTPLHPVDTRGLLEGVGTLSSNLLRLADGYGQAEVSRSLRSGR